MDCRECSVDSPLHQELGKSLRRWELSAEGKAEDRPLTHSRWGHKALSSQFLCLTLEYERWEPEGGPRVGFHVRLGLFLGGEAWRVEAVGLYQEDDLIRNYIDGQSNGWNGWVETTLSY